MEKFGFPAEQQFTMLSKLSGGEKGGSICWVFCSPTPISGAWWTDEWPRSANTRTLEEFLLEFPGCILIVSHDRYFMDRMVDHLFVLKVMQWCVIIPATTLNTGKKCRKGSVAMQPVADKTETKPVETKPAPGKKLSFKEKFELEQLEKTFRPWKRKNRNWKSVCRVPCLMKNCRRFRPEWQRWWHCWKKRKCAGWN